MTAHELAAKEKQEIEEKNRTHPGRTYVPDVDISEDDHGMSLWVDMPGVRQQDIHVHFEDNVLSIEGEVALGDYEGLRPLYTEYNVGRFSRRFTLPNSARFAHDRIAARIAHGVLEVTLPLADAAKPRRIPVTG
jgi:HSP20 family molecular chaperone IbpA